MSIPLRLNNDLVHEAEAEAIMHKRTTPKQIEYWAEIGKVVARTATSSELLALMQGIARIKVTTQSTSPIDPDTVFAEVDRARGDGSLQLAVSQASVHYAASQDHPGLLDRISTDGRCESGHFRDGAFIPLK